jgi:nucleotide-binding universal stress UspA family protein
VSGPVIIGYDGSDAADRAIDHLADLLGSCSVLVVVVWEPGMAFDLLVPGFEPAPIDVRTAIELDEKIYEAARQMAEQGASRARRRGLQADALTVADELTVPTTLIRLAVDRAAPAVAVGSHGHRGIREILLGSTTRELLRRAPCPVIVVRGGEEPNGPDDAGRVGRREEAWSTPA